MPEPGDVVGIIRCVGNTLVPTPARVVAKVPNSNRLTLATPRRPYVVQAVPSSRGEPIRGAWTWTPIAVDEPPATPTPADEARAVEPPVVEAAAEEFLARLRRSGWTVALTAHTVSGGEIQYVVKGTHENGRQLQTSSGTATQAAHRAVLAAAGWGMLV